MLYYSFFFYIYISIFIFTWYNDNSTLIVDLILILISSPEMCATLYTGKIETLRDVTKGTAISPNLAVTLSQPLIQPDFVTCGYLKGPTSHNEKLQCTLVYFFCCFA